MRALVVITVAFLIAHTGCKTKQPATAATAGGPAKAGAPTLIYKTRADYNRFVPVTLSADKKEIVGYPAPADVYYNGKLAYPVSLNNGYLLDNRGIGPNTAFLKITYEDYAKLNSVPTLAELYTQIDDKDPIVEIYNLGDRSRFKNETAEINDLISKGALKKFTKIK